MSFVMSAISLHPHPPFPSASSSTSHPFSRFSHCSTSSSLTSFVVCLSLLSLFLFFFFCYDLFEHILPSLIFLHPLMHPHPACLSPILPQFFPPHTYINSSTDFLNKKNKSPISDSAHKEKIIGFI